MKKYDFNVFPSLMTERLILRQITSEDTDNVYRLLSNPKVIEYDTFELFTEKKQAEDLIRHFNNEFVKKRAIFWGISLKHTNELIGFCKCEVEVPMVRADIGYDLNFEYWNKGIMTEALSKVIDFTFSNLNINRIEASVTTRNHASCKVLEKLGFIKEGVMRERSFWKGKFHDMIMYSLLKEDKGIKAS